uniref:EF-hand domain-containing protein n=1 Tax=Eutreptiella gymnastica TaxID=73025 RepID=A0A7S1NP97_9EUGL|mmetsp:Transcript_64670/g.115014  ORF Transcript_64670/g.115014 Transcript_64670/m.115014 type:complete len:115 (+) Transcript_64670:3-347(+)
MTRGLPDGDDGLQEAAFDNEQVAQALTEMRALKNDVSGALISEEQLREEFQSYDKDGNGYLDKKEFMRMYRAKSAVCSMNEEKVNELVGQYNMMGDGKLSYEEFALLMLKVASW